MNFIVSVLSVVAVSLTLLACIGMQLKDKVKKEVNLWGRDYKVDITYIVGALFLGISFLVLNMYASSYTGYDIYCEFHSPKCENDNLTFDGNLCLNCSSDIMDSGILVGRADDIVVRFSTVFRSYNDYQSVAQFTGFIHCIEFILFILMIVLFLKGIKFIKNEGKGD